MSWTQRGLNIAAWLTSCGGALLGVTAWAKYGMPSFEPSLDVLRFWGTWSWAVTPFSILVRLLVFSGFGAWVLFPFAMSLRLLIKRQPSAVGYLLLTAASLFGGEQQLILDADHIRDVMSAAVPELSFGAVLLFFVVYDVRADQIESNYVRADLPWIAPSLLAFLDRVFPKGQLEKYEISVPIEA